MHSHNDFRNPNLVPLIGLKHFRLVFSSLVYEVVTEVETLDVDAMLQRFHVQHSITSELEAWIGMYEAKLFSIAFSILNDTHLAQDCVQEAFIKAGLKTNQLNNADRVFVWLSRIVVNECKSQLRTSWMKRVTTKDILTEVVHVDKYPSLQETDVYRHVIQLPDKWKMAVLLHYYHDLSLSDVATILHTKESTCRVWLYRARLRLREMMGDADQ